ncbi:MAG: metalloregulator ArsR/SmtB family transcription factor [Magnetospirillum sp. WYHS-4]
METIAAVKALSALAQDTRLAAMRLLIRQGTKGMAAGTIAESLDVVPSTLSHHLNALAHAGLVRSWRVDRHIYYAADLETMRRLIALLTEDCCRDSGCGCGDLARAMDFCGS